MRDKWGGNRSVLGHPLLAPCSVPTWVHFLKPPKNGVLLFCTLCLSIWGHSFSLFYLSTSCHSLTTFCEFAGISVDKSAFLLFAVLGTWFYWHYITHSGWRGDGCVWGLLPPELASPWDEMVIISGGSVANNRKVSERGDHANKIVEYYFLRSGEEKH